jgi:hypothetical protein
MRKTKQPQQKFLKYAGVIQGRICLRAGALKQVLRGGSKNR